MRPFTASAFVFLTAGWAGGEDENMSAGQARDFGGMPLQDDTLSSSADLGANRHAGPSVAPAEGMRSCRARPESERATAPEPGTDGYLND